MGEGRRAGETTAMAGEAVGTTNAATMEDTTIAREIRRKLREIEEKEKVRILYAVESGSRAWGFASPDSDYDVRFIYVRTLEDYLGLEQKRDVIEWQLDEVFDMNGWDIRKALAQFRKSNAAVFEWSNSPIVYWEREEWKKVYETAEEYFRVKPALYQYYGVAKSTCCQFLLGNEVRYKKYFYALRPLLACRYIWDHKCAPPIVFDQLMKTELDSELRREIEELVDRKRGTMEGERNLPIPGILRFIEEELSVWRERIGGLPEERYGDWKELNQVFLSLVKGIWENE